MEIIDFGIKLFINRKDEIQQFLASRWADEFQRRNNAKNSIRRKNLQLLEKFREERAANEKGFKTLADYQNALKLKIDDADLFYEFQSRGCGSMEEFNTLKNEIPKRIEELKKIEENAAAKANDGINNKDASMYINFAYTTLENRTQRLLLSLFPKFQPRDGDEDELLEDTLNHLAAELGFNIPKSSEIAYYRRLRNKIVHHAKDVEFNEGKKAKLFFESLLEEIDGAIEENI